MRERRLAEVEALVTAERPTASPVRTMFRVEADLLSILKGASRRHFLGTRLARQSLVFPHFQIGMTVPDLIFVGPTSKSNRKRRRVSPLRVFDTWVLAELIHEGSLRHDVITRRLHTRTDRTRAALQRLGRLGLVVELGSGFFGLGRRSLHSSVEVVAVEAKLNRWKQAVKQAAEYRRFSNRSYVALPESTIAASHMVSKACRGAGVGLIAVGKRQLTVIVKARREEPQSPEWLWLISKTIGLGR